MRHIVPNEDLWYNMPWPQEDRMTENHMTTARESGDANEYAQGLISAYGLKDAKMLLPMFINDYNPAPESFWSDVATLLRLETASDEGAE